MVEAGKLKYPVTIIDDSVAQRCLLLKTDDVQAGSPGENLQAGLDALGRALEFDGISKGSHHRGDARGVEGLGRGDLKFPGNTARLNVSGSS